MMAEEERCYTRDLIVVMNQDSNPASSDTMKRIKKKD
jgi:hypothetical protein